MKKVFNTYTLPKHFSCIILNIFKIKEEKETKFVNASLTHNQRDENN